MKQYLLVGITGLLFLLAACNEQIVYEEYKDLPGNQWRADSTVSFAFNIADTTQGYDVYYNIRNTLSYPYYNLYINYEMTDPSGKVLQAKMTESNLMDPQTGEPYGVGLGDLFAHSFLLIKNYRFSKPGTHLLKIRQFMRLDTLPHINAVGIRVCHTKPDEQ